MFHITDRLPDKTDIEIKNIRTANNKNKNKNKRVSGNLKTPYLLTNV